MPERVLEEIPEFGSVRIHATISGYTAWALDRYARKRRESLAEAVANALNRWADDPRNAEYLNTYGISLEAFELDDRLVKMPPRKK